jgi:hypothetical protein
MTSATCAADDEENSRYPALSGGPLQGAASDEVHVQMKDRLTGARADIQYGAIAVFDRAFAGDVGGGEMTASDQFGIFGCGFLEAGNMFFGDDENVSRALGMQVFEGKRVLIFVDFFGGDFAANDSAE